MRTLASVFNERRKVGDFKFWIWENQAPGYKTFFMLCSAQPRLKFIQRINVKMPTFKMPTNVGILTFIGSINYWLWLSKPEIFVYLGYFIIISS